MIYCQDCGAANDVAGTFCRICGRSVSSERSSLLCPACSQPIAHQATFCSACGVPVMQAPAAQPAHNFAYAGAGAEGAGGGALPSQPLNPAVQVINESLDLPDWLKRAATEQPQDTTQATDNSFMYTGINPTPIQPPVQAPPSVQPSMQQTAVLGVPPEPSTPWPAQPPVAPSQLPQQQPSGWPQPQSAQAPASAPSAPSNSIWPAQIQPTLNIQPAPASAPQMLGEPAGAAGPARKLLSPEIPNGGLDQGMPSWLNQPPKTEAPQAAMPVAPLPAPAPPSVPVAAASDTTSFISESDLPVWIRQLAEAEEARKANEARAAALESQQPPAPEPPAMNQDLFGEGSFAHRVSQLPGEAEPPAVASSPWLSRREQPVESSTSQADVWSRPVSSGTRRRDEERDVELQPTVAPSVSFQPDQSMQPTAAPSKAPAEKAEPNTLRLVLLIAIVVSLAAVAAYLYTSGAI